MKATRTCTTETCDRPFHARGLCTMHYQRFARRGSLPAIVTITVHDRLFAKLVERESGCLEWTGRTTSGYGSMKGFCGSDRSHRVAWRLANGAIPEGLYVLHHCDNRICCQTDPTPGYPEGHLFLGTHADNMADMVAKGRGRWST